MASDVSDASLVRDLPGFSSGFVEANGVRLHYVSGGNGDPVILLPGWPQTWWAYRKIMPALAKTHRVISVDIRGMGTSDKPAGGYDKKNMALDIYGLMRALGYARAHIVGHDIGSQVAYAFAANHPEATQSLTLLDVPASDDTVLEMRLLPEHGTFGDRIDAAHPFTWWFAFNQVKDMPEALLEGRAEIQQAWFFRYLLKYPDALDRRDRAVYANAYNTRDAIRAGNAWYQAFTQDIIDQRDYPERLNMPVLGIGGVGYEWLNGFLQRRTTRPRVVHLTDSGHFVAEEKPAETSRILLDFLDSGPQK
ncbi:alpha/beta fold hydrolase [Pandoraea anhela]|uniref:alpha/beta fold hydrolase n=1 Tax=Pandoraea anhela TaxID=2508295 RepID=UPI001C2D3CCC|nr:alpha/beta hydrolase [Pandoraea anhela]